MKQQTIDLLENAYRKYAKPDFVDNDPIQLPKRFSKRQDIEIVAFWTAILSWGLRKTIINKSTSLFSMMDNSPHDFILNHKDSDLKPFEDFKHRTFNGTDTLYFIDFFKRYYGQNESLESAFTSKDHCDSNALDIFYHQFFNIEYAPQRTRKHIAAPSKKSTCKRLSMFLRWMVRPDKEGVDLGLWKNLSPSDLWLPLDVHVERTAKHLHLLSRKQRDWKAVLELTDNMKKIDPSDPCRFDFALFGLSIEKELP